jgi:hypothetical protein
MLRIHVWDRTKHLGEEDESGKKADIDNEIKTYVGNKILKEKRDSPFRCFGRIISICPANQPKNKSKMPGTNAI